MFKKTILSLFFITSLAQASEIVVSPKQDKMLAEINKQERLLTISSPASQINIDLQLPFEQRAKFIDFFEQHKIFGEVNIKADKSIQYKGFFGVFRAKNLEHFKDKIEKEKHNLKNKFVKLDSYYFAMANKNTMQDLYEQKMYDHASLVELADKLKLPANGVMLVYPYKDDFVFYAIK